MLYRTVFKRSGDRHFVCFEPECEVAARESMAHDLVARAPFLHCGTSRNIAGDGDFQRRLTVERMNAECQVYWPVGIALLDEVRFLGLGHFFPIVSVGDHSDELHGNRSPESFTIAVHNIRTITIVKGPRRAAPSLLARALLVVVCWTA